MKKLFIAMGLILAFALAPVVTNANIDSNETDVVLSQDANAESSLNKLSSVGSTIEYNYSNNYFGTGREGWVSICSSSGARGCYTCDSCLNIGWLSSSDRRVLYRRDESSLNLRW